MESVGKKHRVWRELWDTCFFLKNLYWGLTDRQCCLKFCCTANWLSYTHTKIHILFLILFHYSLSLDSEYISMHSQQDFVVYHSSVYYFASDNPLLPVLPSPTPFLLATTCLGPFCFGWTLTSPAAEKITWYLPKGGIKQRRVLSLDIGGSHR